MAYVLNNIRFRSVSSKSLERYFNAKSFILNQLADERKQFSRTAREILLLTLNNYSEWLLKVEASMYNITEVTEENMDLMFKRQDEILSTNYELIDAHPSVFAPEFVRVWKHIRDTTLNHFRLKAIQAKGLSPLEAYPLIVDTLVSSLHVTMFELYELDCLLGSDLCKEQVTENRCHVHHLLTYLNDEDLDYYRRTGLCPLIERLETYFKEVFKEGFEVPIILKNYTEVRLALKEGKVIGDITTAKLLNGLVDKYKVNIVEIIH